MAMSRRSMLQSSLAAISAYYAGPALSEFELSARGAPVAAPLNADPLPAAKTPVVGSAFRAGDVRLLPGSPFYDRQELHRKGVLASYDPDKLLFHYRALARLPQREGVRSGYEGWDSGFIRGHMTGHYLSAASRMAVATGDNQFRDRVNYLVTELAKCQDALNLDGYLAAFSPAAFDQLEGKRANSGGIVVPFYTVQKIMSGLLDAYHYIENKQALDVATRMANYFQKRTAALTAEQVEKMFRTDGSRNPQNEFGAMSDAVIELYKLTNDPRHAELARMFNRPWFVGPLAKGEDHLAGLHGNTHIAQAVGLANCANTVGDPDELKASENFWRLVVQKHSFVNGGNSFKEWFDKAGVEVGASIDGQKALPPTSCETCNTNNMLKLTARLIERNPSIEFAEYYERALYNHVLATVAPDTGAMTYFTPLHGDFRTYLNGTFCCTGTGIENAPRYNEGIYFKQNDSLYVNLFIPSELNWQEAGMVLRQEGDVTLGGDVRFTVVKAKDRAISLNFRVPSWVAKAAVFKVNDKVEENNGKPATYVSLQRRWKSRDVIVISLAAAPRLERAKDDPAMVSLFLGPVLLAGALGRDNMPARDVGDKDAYLRTPPAPVPDIVNASANPVDWLLPIPDEKSAFVVRNGGPADGIKFKPLYQVHHERYSVYWRLKQK